MSQLDCSSDSSQSIQSFAPSPIISSTLYTRSPISQIYVLACQAWQPSSARSRELNSTAVPRSLRRRVYETVKRPSVDPSICPIDRRRRAASLLLSAPQFSSVQFGGCEPSVTTATDVVHYTHSCNQHHIMPTNVHIVLFRITYIHTYVHPINGPLSRTTQVSRYQTPIWILLKQETVSGRGISWGISKSAPRPREITTPATNRSVFYRLDALPVAQPTASKH